MTHLSRLLLLVAVLTLTLETAGREILTAAMMMDTNDTSPIIPNSSNTNLEPEVKIGCTAEINLTTHKIAMVYRYIEA